MILYIDPGTGSMLITIIIGLFGTALYFLRNLFLKVRFFGKKDKSNGEKLPIVIFSDDKRYWNVFEPICDELEKREEKAVYMTESEDDPALEKEYKFIETKCIGKGNDAYVKLNHLKAYVVLSTTPSLDVFQWKRSKDVDYYAHILHAPGDLTMYRMFGIDYYDALLLSGEFQGEQNRELEKLRNLPEKEMVYVGLSYMDQLQEKLENFNINQNKQKKNMSDSKEKVVLLAPSWGPNGILRKYGSQLIDKLIDTGYNIVIRPHPQSFVSEKEYIDELIEKYKGIEKLEWNMDNDNFESLRTSDIMISDFSGVIFDYVMVFNKPVIYTTPDYDKSIYDCAWIDKELWTFNILPQIGLELSEDNFVNIKDLIEECLSLSSLSDGRDKARDEAWMNKGKCAESTVNYLIKKKDELENLNKSEENDKENSSKVKK